MSGNNEENDSHSDKMKQPRVRPSSIETCIGAIFERFLLCIVSFFLSSRKNIFKKSKMGLNIPILQDIMHHLHTTPGSGLERSGDCGVDK